MTITRRQAWVEKRVAILRGKLTRETAILQHAHGAYRRMILQRLGRTRAALQRYEAEHSRYSM